MSLKSELYLLNLDERMLQFKRFQHRSDWEIELKARRERWYNIGLAGLVGGYFYSLTVPDVKLERMMDSSVTPMRYAFNWLYTHKRPYALRRGSARFFLWAAPAAMTWSLLSHWTENRRLNKYLAQPTVFGEFARQLVHNHQFDPDEIILPQLGLQKSNQ